ncbi:hypothetical protein Tco_0629061 [Tanacetum coccineum]|uniref:Uncharacterized protein n=1 Tax=Tanacetum coccineum TaxID=301880 RepID=A0ABQ4WS25_9ASTR
MTMHEVVHEMVVGECHESNSEGSSSAWKAYINARVPSLFLLVLLEYPNSKGVVRATSRGLDMALHWSGVGAAPLMSLRQDETSEPLLYAGWIAGSYRWKDATRGRNDDPAYINARVPGLFLLVLLEYPNGMGVVRATSRGLDMALHWSGVGATPLMSQRQDETSEPLLYT